MPNRGVLQAGEKVQFTDRKGKRITDQLTVGGTTQTEHGLIMHDQIIGQTEGIVVTTVRAKREAQINQQHPERDEGKPWKSARAIAMELGRAVSTAFRGSIPTTSSAHPAARRSAAVLAAARQAAAGGRPALVHLITDAEQIAPGRTITDLRTLPIPDAQNGLHDLQAISDIVYSSGYANITRVNQEKQIEVRYYQK